jgi:hypothetical protein
LDDQLHGRHTLSFQSQRSHGDTQHSYPALVLGLRQFRPGNLGGEADTEGF